MTSVIPTDSNRPWWSNILLIGCMEMQLITGAAYWVTTSEQGFPLCGLSNEIKHETEVIANFENIICQTWM